MSSSKVSNEGAKTDAGMNDASRRPFPPTMLGGPLPGEEERPAGEMRPVVVQPPRLPPPRLSIGHVLGEGARILLRHLAPILLLSALLYLPFQGLLWFGPQSNFVGRLVYGSSGSEVVLLAALLLGLGLAVVLPCVLQGWIADGVVHETRGSSRGFLRGAGRRFGRTPAVLGAATSVALVFAGVMGVALALGVLAALATKDPYVIVLLILLGGLVVVTLSCVFYVIAPVVVVEGVGPLKALGRSAALTRGARLAIFAIQLMFQLAGLGVGLGVGALIGASPGGSGSPALAFLSSALVAVVFAAINAVCAVVAYADLVRHQEGFAIEELTEVFE